MPQDDRRYRPLDAPEQTGSCAQLVRLLLSFGAGIDALQVPPFSTRSTGRTMGPKPHAHAHALLHKHTCSHAIRAAA